MNGIRESRQIGRDASKPGQNGVPFLGCHQSASSNFRSPHPKIKTPGGHERLPGATRTTARRRGSVQVAGLEIHRAESGVPAGPRSPFERTPAINYATAIPNDVRHTAPGPPPLRVRVPAQPRPKRRRIRHGWERWLPGLRDFPAGLTLGPGLTLVLLHL